MNAENISFVNRNGKIIQFDENLTIKQLVELGVMRISLVNPDAPFSSDNEYRSTDSTHPQSRAHKEE